MQSTLTLPALCQNFTAVEALVEASARMARLDRSQRQRLLLAVDEVWRRLVEPADQLALPDEEREVEVCVECGSSTLAVFLSDELDREGIDPAVEGAALEFAKRCVDRLEVDETLLGGRCVCLEVRSPQAPGNPRPEIESHTASR